MAITMTYCSALEVGFGWGCFAPDISLRKQVRSDGLKPLPRILRGAFVWDGQMEMVAAGRAGGGHDREGTPGTWQLRAMRLYAYMPLARDSHLTLPLFYSGTHICGHPITKFCLFTAVTMIPPLKSPDIGYLGGDD